MWHRRGLCRTGELSPPAPLTPADVRRMDRMAEAEFGLPTLVLMENAGRQCAQALLTSDPQPGRVVVLAGKGNNGGDGFVMARHLDGLGVDVSVITWWPETEMSPDAAVNAKVLRLAAIPFHILDVTSDVAGDVQQVTSLLGDANWVVDALLGIGGSGPPRQPIATGLEAVAAHPARRFSIDWPTGVSCSDGNSCSPHPFRAELTCTLVQEKLHQQTAAPYCGEIVIADIGLPSKLLQQFAAAKP